jgi:hypothetical protein
LCLAIQLLENGGNIQHVLSLSPTSTLTVCKLQDVPVMDLRHSFLKPGSGEIIPTRKGVCLTGIEAMKTFLHVIKNMHKSPGEAAE